ncbi:MAG: hypothetical protein M0024_04650, partial [Nitrospiraceae bacterium]|nr:hypothetical protein [Nitrospiraceae bacterium]
LRLRGSRANRRFPSRLLRRSVTLKGSRRKRKIRTEAAAYSIHCRSLFFFGFSDTMPLTAEVYAASTTTVDD